VVKDGLIWLAVVWNSELAAAALNGAGGGSVRLLGIWRAEARAAAPL
jgi:hypothetical protein